MARITTNQARNPHPQDAYRSRIRAVLAWIDNRKARKRRSTLDTRALMVECAKDTGLTLAVVRDCRDAIERERARSMREVRGTGRPLPSSITG